MSNTIQSKIEQAVQAGFQIYFSELINESHMHSGPAPESHFKLTLVSDDFNEMSKVKRQQAVYRALAEIMPTFHALALHTYTPTEWHSLVAAPTSPRCMGGH